MSVDYYGIEEAIAAQIRAYGFQNSALIYEGDAQTGGPDHLGLEGDQSGVLLIQGDIPVVVEESLDIGEQPKIFLWLERREAPDEWQVLASDRTRLRCTYSVWCFAFGLNIKAAMRLRSELVARAELALMRDPTFGRSDVITSWLDGGDFDIAKRERGLVVGAEILVSVFVNQKISSADVLLLESGDALLLESGDSLLLESST